MPDENGEPFGFELIHGTGSIATCDIDEVFEVPERRFPFGFCAPAPVRALTPVPVLCSAAWAAWLEVQQ